MEVHTENYLLSIDSKSSDTMVYVTGILLILIEQMLNQLMKFSLTWFAGVQGKIHIKWVMGGV